MGPTGVLSTVTAQQLPRCAGEVVTVCLRLNQAKGSYIPVFFEENKNRNKFSKADLEFSNADFKH